MTVGFFEEVVDEDVSELESEVDSELEEFVVGLSDCSVVENTTEFGSVENTVIVGESEFTVTTVGFPVEDVVVKLVEGSPITVVKVVGRPELEVTVVLTVDFPDGEVVIVVEVVDVFDAFVGVGGIGGIVGFAPLHEGLAGGGIGSLKDLATAQENISFPTGTQDPSSLQVKVCSAAQII